MNKELLQQALDAFEAIFETTAPYREDGECTFHASAIAKAIEAIAALGAAIAQPDEPVAWYDEEIDCAYSPSEIDWGSTDGLKPLYTHPAPAIAQPTYDTRQFSNLSNQAHGFAQPVQQAVSDADRLDWLDAQNLRLKMGWKVSSAPVSNVSITSVIQLSGKKVTPIREAIDAAMQSKGATE